MDSAREGLIKTSFYCIAMAGLFYWSSFFLYSFSLSHTHTHTHTHTLFCALLCPCSCGLSLGLLHGLTHQSQQKKRWKQRRKQNTHSHTRRPCVRLRQEACVKLISTTRLHQASALPLAFGFLRSRLCGTLEAIVSCYSRLRCRRVKKKE